MPVRFMIDSDNLSMLSDHIEINATYADLVPNYEALAAKLPNSTLVLIDRGSGDPSGKASVFDIEPGALTPQQALQHFLEQQARGVEYLTCYHDRSQAEEVDAVFKGHTHFTWDATLDGTAHIIGERPLFAPSIIQCLSATMLGYHADGSLVFNDAWHPRPPSGISARAKVDLHRALSQIAMVSSELHGLAAAIGG